MRHFWEKCLVVLKDWDTRAYSALKHLNRPSPPQQLQSANYNLNDKKKTQNSKKKKKITPNASRKRRRDEPSHTAPRHGNNAQGSETVPRLTPHGCTSRPFFLSFFIFGLFFLFFFWLCDLFSNSLQGYQESRLAPRSRRHAVKCVVFSEPMNLLGFLRVVFCSFSPRVDLISVSNLKCTNHSLYEKLWCPPL